MNRERAKLPIPEVLPGGRSVLERSYSLGRKNYSRVLQDDNFLIHLTFKQDVPIIETPRLHIERLTESEITSIEFPLQGGPWKFFASLPTETCGVYRFKVKYRVYEKWWWDSAPFSYFILDPKCIQDLRIYSFIPTASGHMGQWKKDLNRIRDLGFNTLHLLPVTEMDVSESPYAAKNLFTIDPAYVDPHDPKDGLGQFEDFVKLLQENQMRLCIDLVFNNIGIHSDIAKYRAEWLEEDSEETDGVKRAGWSDGKIWNKWEDLALFNYAPLCPKAQEKMWHHMTEYALFWCEFAASTGGMVRLDNLHSSHEGFMRHVLGKIRQAYPDLIFFAELFDKEERLEKLVLDYGIHLLLATPWEHKFVPELREYFVYLHRKHPTLRYYCPISSHDSGSPAQEFGNVNSTIPRLALSMLFGPGPSGITQGVEFGLEERLDFKGRREKIPIPHIRDFGPLITKLNELTRSHSVFQTPGNLKFIDHYHPALLVAYREDLETKNASFLLFANFDTENFQKIELSLDTLSKGGFSLKERLLDGQFALSSAQLRVELSPCGIGVFELVPPEK